jgi:hypothetical protein
MTVSAIPHRRQIGRPASLLLPSRIGVNVLRARERVDSKMSLKSPRVVLPSTDFAPHAQSGTRNAPGDASADIRNRREGRCPECGGGLIRVRRRLVDRLQGAFIPVKRFRCPGMRCGYVGNRTTAVVTRHQAWFALICFLAATIAGAPTIVAALYSTPGERVGQESPDPAIHLEEYSADVLPPDLATASGLSPFGLAASAYEIESSLADPQSSARPSNIADPPRAWVLGDPPSAIGKPAPRLFPQPQLP